MIGFYKKYIILSFEKKNSYQISTVPQSSQLSTAGEKYVELCDTAITEQHATESSHAIRRSVKKHHITY